MGEEVEGGTLGAFPPGTALGESETPRCHLTTPLLVTARGDAGSRAPVSLPGQKSPVGTGSRVPLPGLLALPGCLDSHSSLHARLFTPAPCPAPADFHPSPSVHSASLRSRESFHSLLSFLFFCHNFLGSFSTLNQRGGENLSSKGILRESKENDPRRPPHPRGHRDARRLHLRAERRATLAALWGQEIWQKRRESTIPRPPHLLALRNNLSFAPNHLRLVV